jgi:ribokinase
MDYEYLTIGGATRDTFFEVDAGIELDNPEGPTSPRLLSFEYGGKYVAENAGFSYGGGAINAAVCLSKLGFKTAGCFRIGADATGQALLGDINEHEADWSYAEIDSKKHTALSYIISVPSVDRVVFLYPGAVASLEAPDLEQIKTRWIYLSSLRGPAESLLPRIEAKVRAEGTHLAFNPGESQIKRGYPYLEKTIACARVLLVNRPEATDLVRSADPNAAIASIEDLFRTMRNWGPEYIVITDGNRGSNVYHDGTARWQGALKTNLVDMTGAGDSYGATFAGALSLYDGDITKAMRLATANSASVVSRQGAHRGALTLGQAEDLAARAAASDARLLEL